MKKVIIFLVVVALILGLGSLTQASATVLTFWLNAWNEEEQPEWVGAGFITFRIVFYDEFEAEVGDPINMQYAGAGALYWRNIDSDEFDLLGGEWFGAVSWSVEFVGGNWNLADEFFDPFQPQGAINFGGNNVCDPEDWFFVPANGR